MTKATDATMRRIAIVLASLPESVAQRLLGSLPRENQRLVRTALAGLSEVDPLEQRRALDGFASSLRKDKPSAPKNSEAAEIVFSRAAIRNLHERGDDRSITDSSKHLAGHEGDAQASAAPLAFLLDVDDETLVAHLKGEMPQTLAIILASISPSQAARVLPRLDPAVRADAMRRIANLKELPADLIDDIGSHLRDRFATYGNNGTGRRALDAILAEMSQVAPAKETVNYEPAPSAARQGEARKVAEPDASNVAVPLKVAEGTWPESPSPAQPLANRTEPESTPSLRTVSPPDSTDATHAYLLSLPIDRLRETLGRSETRQALLTLCGLPNSVAEALLASLPRRQAKQVRDQLASLGTLQLREIDEAKAAIAKIAYESDRGRAAGRSDAIAGSRPASEATVPRQAASSLTAAAA